MTLEEKTNMVYMGLRKRLEELRDRTDWMRQPDSIVPVLNALVSLTCFICKSSNISLAALQKQVNELWTLQNEKISEFKRTGKV